MTDLVIGTGISSSAAPSADPVAEALAAERAGYDFVSASDHPVGDHPTYDVLSMLTWVAARTTRIGVATRVLGVPFRRPAMVAKTAESLQRLSGGRLVLGLGAGHLDDEILALGGAPLTPGQKVAGLSEAITIMRGGWTGQSFDHDGQQHSVRGLRLTPSPVAPIPIWLGTYGPRALTVTGRLADGWIPSLGAASREELPRMLDQVRAASVEAGRSPDAVRPVLNVTIRLDPRLSTDAGSIGGSAADVVDQLGDYVDLGFRGFNLQPAGAVEAVAAEVLPALRGRG
jgi:alkanesulfonate monooxygenase SsuD/methylene tetrahydromethanopterin reductase-like flavin-dependent oxidoreductase (luciferase family)